MSLKDIRGLDLSGATAAALDPFEWRASGSRSAPLAQHFARRAAGLAVAA